MSHNPQGNGLTIHSPGGVRPRLHVVQPKTQDTQPVTSVPAYAWQPREGSQVYNGTSGWCLERKLGDGGAGEVWLGRNDSLTQAFKFFHDNDNARLLYDLEKGNLGVIREKLKSLPSDGAGKHIVMMRDVQFKEAPYWLSFDYIEGGTLKDIMVKGPMPWQEAWDLLQPLLECMAVVHDLGVVHRDLKPANILLTNNTKPYMPKITDFGIGKVLVDSVVRVQAGSNKSVFTTAGSGTFGYMSREQMRREAAHTSDDVYAFAVILWQMLAGPTANGELKELVYPSHIDELRVASYVKKALHDCVFEGRDKRPPDAGALLKRLQPRKTRKILLYSLLLLGTTSLAAPLLLENKSLLANILPLSLPYVYLPVVNAPPIALPAKQLQIPSSMPATFLPSQPDRIASETAQVEQLVPDAVLTSRIVADAGTAQGRFVKIGATGAELSSDATTWACVKDTQTGLMWEVKTDDGSVRDKDHTYTWASIGTTMSGSSCVGQANCDTASYVNTINGHGLCGAADWRIPKREELRSIVDYGRSEPAIDTDFFPNTQASRFWSASASVGSTEAPWYVSFFNGADDYLSLDPAQYLRLVRR